MDKKFAFEWADELESGKYPQTSGRLFNGYAYCCLGVACKMAGETFIRSGIAVGGEPIYFIDDGHKNGGGLSDRVKNLAGMYSIMGAFIPGTEASKKLNSLYVMNDEGKTFKEIAKHIRENYADL
jgi:hypothetical protein